jgi:predicted ATPase
MPSRDDRGGEGIGVGGESSQGPLIGRELELDVLRQHIARVVETRRGHVVLILGESGVGKSRLAAEAGTEARKRGLTLIPVRCLGRGAEPLLPVKEALVGYLGRTPDQIRWTLARAAPRLLDAVRSLGRSWASLAKDSPRG